MDACEPNYTELYRDVAPAVVSIYVDAGDDRSSGGAGSGFVYDRSGHVVTNHHVIAAPEGGTRRR